MPQRFAEDCWKKPKRAGGCLAQTFTESCGKARNQNQEAGGQQEEVNPQITPIPPIREDRTQLSEGKVFGLWSWDLGLGTWVLGLWDLALRTA